MQAPDGKAEVNTTPVGTLDVRGVADLQEKHTGRRPSEATIRSYHSRGRMPAQVAPGRWVHADIELWLRQRRVRPSEKATRELCDTLAATARESANTGNWAPVDRLVGQAREINIAWASIGAAIDISGQAAWARYRQRPDRGI